MPHFMLAFCPLDKCETSFWGQLYRPMAFCCLNSQVPCEWQGGRIKLS